MSELSEPDQSTTVPSEYVCRTPNVYVLFESVCARNWKNASSPVGTEPPVQVTFVTTALSPDPVDSTSRCQPGDGTNESIEKPLGGVNSIFVVAELASSVGTARLKSWAVFESDDGRADPCVGRRAAATTSAAAATSPTTMSTPPREVAVHS